MVPGVSHPWMVPWGPQSFTLGRFLSGGMILGFAQGKETLPLSLSETVSGVINMGVLTGPMLLQPLVGFLLILQTNSSYIDGNNSWFQL